MAFWKQVVSFVNEDLDQMGFNELLEWAKFWVQEGGFWLFPSLAGYLGWARNSLPFKEIRGELTNHLSALQIQYDVAKELFERARSEEKRNLLLKELRTFQKACQQFLRLLASSEKVLLHLEKNGSTWLKEANFFTKFFISGPTILEAESVKRPISPWIKPDEDTDPAFYRLEDKTGVLGLLYDRLPDLKVEYLGFCPVCFKIFWKSRKDKIFCQRKCQSLYFVRRARMQKKPQKSLQGE